jgi:hypothetical protein
MDDFLTKGARHRQAVYKNRERQRQSKKVLRQHHFDLEEEDEEDQRKQQDIEDEDVNSTYSCNDAISSVITDVELPNRMNHMEYLRQMKAKAQSIQQKFSTVTKDTSGSPNVEEKEDEVDPLVSAKATVSKVRARLEEFKAEAAKNQVLIPEKKLKQVKIKEESDNSKTESIESIRLPDTATSTISISNTSSTVQVLVEGVYVYASVDDLLEGERLLLENAASKRMQTFLRAKHSKAQLCKLKEAKALQKAAETIQYHTRRYLIRVEIERREEERRFQQEQQAKELYAAQQEALQFSAAQRIQQEFKRFQTMRRARADEKKEPQDDIVQPSIESEKLMDAAKEEPPVEIVPPLDLKLAIQLNPPSDLSLSAKAHQSPNTHSNSCRESLEQQMISFPPSQQPLISSRAAKQVEEQLLIRNMAASHIQAFFKGIWVRQRLVEMHARRISSDYLEKNHMRVEIENVVSIFFSFHQSV